MTTPRCLASVGLTCTVWALLLASSGASAQPAADKPAEGSKRQIGNMVLDGVPTWDDGVRQRLMQYLEVRPTGVADIAEDGQSLMVSTRFANTNQLHLVTSPLGMRKQVTFFDEPVSGGRFVPGSNGRRVLFGKDRGGDEKNQYYVLDLDSGRWTLLTDGKSRNAGPSLSKSGKRLAFTSTARNEKDFDLYLLDLGAALARGAADTAAIGSVASKSSGGGFEVTGSVQAVGAESAAIESETQPKMVWQVAGQYYAGEFSPDESQLLVMRFVSERETQWFLFDVATHKPTPITPEQPPQYYGSAAWAPDGKAIYITSDRDGEFRKLYRFGFEYGDWKCLTPNLEWDVEDVSVDPAGKGIAYTVNEDGVFRLYFADLWGNGARRIEGLPQGVIGGLRFADKGGALATSVNSSGSPSDAYVISYPEAKIARWTESEVGGLNAARFVEPTWIRYPTFDQVDGQARMIPCLYYKAPQPGPRPVVVYVHGGPEGQTLPTFSSTFQMWARELGISVLCPNVRGSTGYGRTFHQIDNGVQREDAVKDVGALLDWIKQQPEIDGTRIGIYGGSYGGYMVLGSLTNFPERFKAAIDVVGITSFVSFLETTPEFRRDLRRAEYGDERDPAVRAVLERISPLNNAEKIKAALFVLHGKNDPRVPVTEAEQIVAKLRGLGRSVWYAVALDEGHGFGKKANRDLSQVLYAVFWQEHLLK
ncbi:MAG: prolyl oligopeptidase family serine peptidase [Phycisphaerae bacterium]